MTAGVGINPTNVSFCPMDQPYHIQAYHSSSDSENEAEKIHNCEASRAAVFSKLPFPTDRASSSSSVYGGGVYVIEPKGGSSPGTPTETPEPADRPHQLSPVEPRPIAPFGRDLAPEGLEYMRRMGRTEDPSPGRHSMEPNAFPGRLFVAQGRGDSPFPSPRTCEEPERNFPLTSFNRTDSVGNLASEPPVDPISLPDRHISDPSVFYVDPVGTAMLNPPTPKAKGRGKSATLSEKNASRDSEMDEANSSAIWQSYNNVRYDTAPLDSPAFLEESESPRKGKSCP